jgi:hypothetical protein
MLTHFFCGPRFTSGLWLAAILTLPASASGQNETKKAEPPTDKQGDAQVLEELKALQAAVVKLQGEIKELRATKLQTELKELHAEKQRQQDATQKYAKAFLPTFLDLAITHRGDAKDAVRMLTKDLRSELGLDARFYTNVLGDEYKSRTADSHEWAPNQKAVIVRRNFKGISQKKDVTVPFVLHLEM